MQYDPDEWTELLREKGCIIWRENNPPPEAVQPTQYKERCVGDQHNITGYAGSRAVFDYYKKSDLILCKYSDANGRILG